MLFTILLLCLFSFTRPECNDLCSDKAQYYPRNCFCTQCSTFSDCCRDQQKPITEKISTKYSCNARTGDFYIYTIGQCQQTFTDEQTIKNCEMPDSDFIYQVPVYTNKNVYKNIYCAKCNLDSIDTNDLTMFEVTYNLTKFPFEVDEALLKKILSGQEKHVNLNIKAPDHIPSPRNCLPTVHTCPSNYTNQSVVNQCHSFTAVRYDTEGIAYKNEYCAACHGVFKLDCYIGSIRKLYLTSLQLLFDLTDLSNEVVIKYDVQVNRQSALNQSIRVNKISEFNDDCNTELTQDKIKKYLTISGNSISIASLICLLFFYFRNKVLRNFAGKILINLSLSLLFSQLFFMISVYFTESYVEKKMTHKSCALPDMVNKFENASSLLGAIGHIFPCYLMSFLTHYFYLTFFVWSNIMAFDLFKMFSNSSRLSTSDANSLFLKYSLFSWLLPLVFILALNLKNQKSLTYGFKLCFISSSLDLLVFFVLPICVILVLNTIFMIISVRSIKKIDKISKKYLKSESSSVCNSGKQENKVNGAQNENANQRLVLFVKIFVLTGLTWTIGIVSSLMNDKYSFIWYIYIVFNSFQGLFIFCSYAFNRNPRSNLRSSMLRTVTSMLSKRSSTKNSSSTQQTEG
ncbi:G- coupled receptor Mth2 [Brachionus plicatilis]|uniref:G-coupled receptor Mth2 n=1 Tax=Brachionus plicatilis TaxID=10195 RepID=A0A3M7R663_BRAPC|nr:G- coupled receptor Mth2 [Brachionus plicatilis]